MLRKYSTFVLFIALLLAVGFVTSARAEVLFTDSFNTATVPGSGNDYGLNTDLVARQAGSSLLSTNPTGLQWARHTPGNWTQAADTVQVNSATIGANMMGLYNGGSTNSAGGSTFFYMNTIIQHDFAPDLSGKAFTLRWDTDPLSAGTPTSQSRVAGTFAFIGCSTANGAEGGSGNTGLGFYDTSNDILRLHRRYGDCLHSTGHESDLVGELGF